MKSIKPVSAFSIILLALMCVDVGNSQTQPPAQDLGDLAAHGQTKLDCMFKSTPPSPDQRLPECANIPTIDEQLASVDACNFAGIDRIIREAAEQIDNMLSRWDAYYDNLIGLNNVRSSQSQEYLVRLPESIAKSKAMIAELEKQLAVAQQRLKDREPSPPENTTMIQSANEPLIRLIKVLQQELVDQEAGIRRKIAAGREFKLEFETDKDESATFAAMKWKKKSIAGSFEDLLQSKKHSRLRQCRPPSQDVGLDDLRRYVVDCEGGFARRDMVAATASCNKAQMALDAVSNRDSDWAVLNSQLSATRSALAETNRLVSSAAIDCEKALKERRLDDARMALKSIDKWSTDPRYIAADTRLTESEKHFQETVREADIALQSDKKRARQLYLQAQAMNKNAKLALQIKGSR